MAPHLIEANRLVSKLNDVILFPLITLLTAIAMLIFFWGIFQYVIGGAEGESRETGRRHILYGIIGFVVMMSAYTILRIAGMTFGCDVNVPGSCGSI